MEVWNWDGLPLRHYRLDKPVTQLAVSSPAGSIYAISPEREDIIYIYSL